MYKPYHRIASLLLAGAMVLSTGICTYAEEAAGPGAAVTEAAAENTQTSEVTNNAPDGSSGTADNSVSAGAANDSTVTGGEADNQQRADDLTAEQAAAAAAAAAEAAQLNNPLTVPERQPLLHTAVLWNGNQAWSHGFINDQQIELDGQQSFSSISTFIENIHGNVLYRAYTSERGWTNWAMNGQQTTHQVLWTPIEAIQYRFAGPVANKFDIYYSAVLSDGTQTGWAKNGETAGTMGQGLYMVGFRLAFFVRGTEHGLNTAKPLVSAHADGIQVVDGVLRYITGTGANYTGWGWSGNDQYYFVDSAPVTGWQYVDGFKYYFGEDGKLWTDVEPLVGSGGPYMIKINKEMNCMTIYTTDGANGYIVPVKSFLTSVGDDTPLGTFKTPEKYRWRLMIHDVYTQYATRLGAGLPILMHSIIYDASNPYTVWASTYNNMGIARSAGCIRLVSGDAKWVYDHCPLGTTVVVYNSSIPGPFERPTIKEEIPFEQTWDPTDPNITPEGIAAATAAIMAKFGQ